MKQRRLWPAVVVMALALASACGGSSGGGSSDDVDVTVWVDAARLPAAEAYEKAHPDVKMDIVTYDGDGNGATTLQTKIQLWNRSGKGWPDVIFSQQVQDPVWMAQKPFEFAAPLEDLISEDVLSQWPETSTAQCTVDGKQYCVQDNLAQVVLWVNQKKMDEFGYTVPTTWQEWAALGEKVATEHPGYIVGNIGDSYSHWIYLWGNQCPIQQLNGDKLTINAADEHCTEMADLLDPLIENGSLPPLSVFTPDFAQQYGGDDDKVLMMPGPAWYAQAVFDDGAPHPGRGDDRRERPGVGRRAGDHRSGRRWPMDHLAARQELRRRGGLRHLGDDRVRPDRKTGPATRPTRRRPRSGCRGWRPAPTSRRIPRRRSRPLPTRSGRAGAWSPIPTSPSGRTRWSRSWWRATR